MKKNYEFFYSAVLMLITTIFLIVIYREKLRFSEITIAGLSLVGFLGLVAGYVYINGVRLMDLGLINGIVKYDNVLHFFMVLVVFFGAYDILKPHLDRKLKNNFMFFLILILIANGVGALIEVFEFGIVLVFPGSGVGDYFNNAIDLVCNLLGSIVGCVIIWIKQ